MAVDRNAIIRHVSWSLPGKIVLVLRQGAITVVKSEVVVASDTRQVAKNNYKVFPSAPTLPYRYAVVVTIPETFTTR